LPLPVDRFPELPSREPYPLPEEDHVPPEFIKVYIPYRLRGYIADVLMPMTYLTSWDGSELESALTIRYIHTLIAEVIGENAIPPGWYWTLGDTNKSVLGKTTRIATGTP
jgi:hypothetical protein